MVLAPRWTLKRVRVFIERQFGVRYSDVHVWRLLADGLFQPEAGTARWNGRGGHRGLEEAHLAWAQKKPAGRVG